MTEPTQDVHRRMDQRTRRRGKFGRHFMQEARKFGGGVQPVDSASHDTSPHEDTIATTAIPLCIYCGRPGGLFCDPKSGNYFHLDCRIHSYPVAPDYGPPTPPTTEGIKPRELRTPDHSREHLVRLLFAACEKGIDARLEGGKDKVVLTMICSDVDWAFIQTEAMR